jgi:hypothetical protein
MLCFVLGISGQIAVAIQFADGDVRVRFTVLDRTFTSAHDPTWTCARPRRARVLATTSRAEHHQFAIGLPN